MQHLKRSGFHLGIVSNKQFDLTMAGLQKGHIADLFDTIVTLDHVRNGKLDAESVELAMRNLGAGSESSLMVGDSKYDVLAAKAANVKSAVLEWYGSEQWPKVTPDYRFRDFDQLVAELATVRLHRRT